MSELSVENKMGADGHTARMLAAEEHFFDKNQPFFPCGFSISRRGVGHWDVGADKCMGHRDAFMAANPGGFTTEREDERERAFRIRGEVGNVQVYDERWNPHNPHPRETIKFRSVMAAMVWICEELMQEPKL